jgi:hypothetical protein
MPDSNDLLSSHPIKAKMEALDELLDEFIAKTKVETDIESLQQLKAKHSYLMRRVIAVDPALLSKGPLDLIDGQVAEEMSRLKLYHSFQLIDPVPNRNARQHLADAISFSNQILVQLGSLPLPLLPEGPGAEGVREILTSIRRSAGQYARQIHDEYDALKSTLEAERTAFAALTADLNSQKGRLDTAIAEFQKQFSTAEESRREASSNLIEEGRKAINSAVEAGRGEFQTLVKEMSNAFASDRKTLNDQADVVITELLIKQEKAEAVLRVIGNTGMVEGYQRVANDERTTAKWWHAGTLVFIVGLITFAIVAFWNTISGEFHLGTFGARAFVALTFGIAAAYAAREADKHQAIERKNRRVELELASIDPFLSAMPEEMQNEVKRQLAERIFGQNDPLTTKEGETTGTLVDLLKMALNTLNNFSKK